MEFKLLFMFTCQVSWELGGVFCVMLFYDAWNVLTSVQSVDF